MASLLLPDLSMDHALTLDRLQFAFTITFHYILPQLTMGLALLIVIRGHIRNGLRGSFRNVVLCGASALLAIFYGAALGNVVRGVPLDRDGYFFVPLWTDFATGAAPGIIDWYTVLVGVTALLVLTLHGSLWVALKTEGELQNSARRIASPVYWGVCASVLAITIASFLRQPHLQQSFSEKPWLWLFPLLAATGLLMLRWSFSASLHLWAFLGSAIFIAGLLCSAAFALFPFVLPSSGDPSLSLTVYKVAAPQYGLKMGFIWWIPGFLLAITYSTLIYRHFSGKVGEPVAEKEINAA